MYLAIEHDLEIIPILNKVDMESAMVDEVSDQIIDLIGCDAKEIIPASAKTGVGIQEILEAIVERVSSPEGDDKEPLQALIFDSVFNPFRGIEAYFKIVNGTIRKGDKVKFTIRFKGRELQHSHLGNELMTKIKEDMKDVGKVELHPKFDGKQMIMVIQPL